MNYLAHLFLAASDDEFRVGSLLADFVNGPIPELEGRFGRGIATGIRHHREIDRFTDTHPAVCHSVNRMGSVFGLYSGIVADVVFDHFLLQHWERFSERHEESFFNDVYASLGLMDDTFPERYRQVVTRMRDRRWLCTYREMDTVVYALSRIDERFSRRTPLSDAREGIVSQYAVLETDFLRFFPDLQLFSAKIVDDLIR